MKIEDINYGIIENGWSKLNHIINEFHSIKNSNWSQSTPYVVLKCDYRKYNEIEGISLSYTNKYDYNEN